MRKKNQKKGLNREGRRKRLKMKKKIQKGK